MLFLDSERYFWAKKTNPHLPEASGRPRLSFHKNASPLMLMRLAPFLSTSYRPVVNCSSAAYFKINLHPFTSTPRLRYLLFMTAQRSRDRSGCFAAPPFCKSPPNTATSSPSKSPASTIFQIQKPSKYPRRCGAVIYGMPTTFLDLARNDLCSGHAAASA